MATHLRTWETYWLYGGSSGAQSGFDTYGQIRVYLDSQSAENNTSSIYIDHYAYAQLTDSSIGVIVDISSTYRANNGSYGGTYKTSSKEITVSPNTGVKSYYLGRTWHTINHNTDGTAKLYINGYILNEGTRTNSSFNMTLSTIPRASAITATRAYIGEISQLTVTKRNENYVHSIQYQFGELTGYILADGTTTDTETKITEKNIGFTIPTNFYEQMPNSQSSVCTLTIKTYNGDTQIGSAQTTTFYVDVLDSEENRPSLTVSVVDTNETTKALTDVDNKLIKGYSIASVSYEATAKNYARISSVTVNGQVVTESPVELTNFSANTIEVVATDSRTFPTTKVPEYTLIDYFEPTISISAKRTAPTEDEIMLSFSGNIFNQSFGTVMNELSLSWVYRIKGSQDWTTGGTFVRDTDYIITDNTFHSGISEYTSEISLGNLFSYENNYEIGVIYDDSLVTPITTVSTVSKGIPIVNWNDTSFNVNGDIKKENVSIFEMFYPIGSIYMSINNVSPETFFGGTWEQIKDTFLLSAGDTYNAGSTGGESKHTLTINEMPAHSHGGWWRKVNGTGTEYVAGLADSYEGIAGAAVASSSGGGQAFDIMPPYLTVYMWKRIS